MSCCCSSSSSNLMPLDEALSLLVNSAIPVTDEEAVMLDEAMGRVLSQPVTSTINVPNDARYFVLTRGR